MSTSASPPRTGSPQRTRSNPWTSTWPVGLFVRAECSHCKSAMQSVQTRFFLVCLFRFRWLACAPAQCAETGESRNLAFKRPPRFRNQNFGLQAICRSNQNLLTASTRNKQMFKINKVLYVVLHFIFSGTRKFSSSFKTPPKQQSFFQHILMP